MKGAWGPEGPPFKALNPGPAVLRVTNEGPAYCTGCVSSTKERAPSTPSRGQGRRAALPGARGEGPSGRHLLVAVQVLAATLGSEGLAAGARVRDSIVPSDVVFDENVPRTVVPPYRIP